MIYRSLHFFIFSFVGLLLMQSCRKNEVKSPSFTVTTGKTTYKVGDTIVFNFSNGNPNIISFYSGEIGKRYKYANRAKAYGIPKLQFNSLVANGTQANSLAIMVSTDFKGSGSDETETAANIVAATWTDITNRATLSTGSNTSSGPIDLSDIAAGNKPVYLAFRYKGEPGSIQRKWTINNLTVKNTLTDGTEYTLANHTNTTITNYGVTGLTFSPGWVSARVANAYSWTVGSSSLVITGATTAAAATAPAEAWTFSGLIDLHRVTPDLGLSIKDIRARLASFTYIYKTAGTYTATFHAINKTAFDEDQQVREIQLTITH